MTGKNLEQLMNSVKSTLKATSKDKEHNEYMVNITDMVVSFDNYMDKYVDGINSIHGCKPKSCDALLELDGNRYVLVEFKNGRVDKDDVRSKMSASCLCLLDTLDKKVDYARTNIDFILVYNGEKNSCKTPTKKLQKNEVQTSTSFDLLRGSVLHSAALPVVMPGFECYEMLWFRKVRTYSAEIFEYEYKNGFPNMH